MRVHIARTQVSDKSGRAMANTAIFRSAINVLASPNCRRKCITPRSRGPVGHCALPKVENTELKEFRE